MLLLFHQALVSIAVITYIIFNNVFESLFTVTIVNNVLAEIESKWYNDLFFIMGVAFIVTSTIIKFRKHILSVNLFLTSLAVFLIYFYYRCISDVWVFTPVSLFPSVKYADFLLLLPVISVLMLFHRVNHLPPNVPNSFFDDEPLGTNKEDELGYSDYAKILAEKIISSHFARAFAIGINGKWGVGKTSFIDLIKRHLSMHDYIEVNFNPWNSSDPQAIINDFFETIEEEIKPYHSSLARLLAHYSHKLTALDDNIFSKSVQALVSLLAGSDSTSTLFDQINHTLKVINKKIIIFIDDLDRLDKVEILEVIRLIRNTANFYNTFFIVAYDKNYIGTAIREHNSYKYEQFLEKVFQIEVTLPYFEKLILRQKLAKKLMGMFPSHYHKAIETEIIGTASMTPVYLNEWLTTIRDITRLSNSLSLNMRKLIGEVDFFDFLRLEILRLKHPSVYELLFKRTNEFLDTTKTSTQGENHYKLKEIEKSKKKDLFIDIDNELEFYLLNNSKDLSVPEDEINRIITLVDNIFNSGSLGYSKSYLSVVYPSKFERYFAYNLLEGSLSEVEFITARGSSLTAFQKQIDEWVTKKLEFEVKARLKEVKAFENREDFEKVISAIFYLANRKTMFKNFYNEGLVGYEGSDLLSKLNNYDNKINKTLYSNGSGTGNVKAFMLQLFNNATFPFTFEAEFLRYINSEFSDSFVLSKDETKEIVLDYFRKYCNESPKFDHNFWHLYNCCQKTDFIPAGGDSYHHQEKIFDEANGTARKFIIGKGLDGFLLSVVDDNFARKNDGYAIHNSVVRIFGSWESFKKVLFEELKDDGSQYLAEFKEFFNAFELTAFSKYIDFRFKVIPINRE